MKANEYEALMKVIEAKVSEMIGDAFSRPSLHESVRFYQLEEEFKEKYVEGEE